MKIIHKIFWLLLPAIVLLSGCAEDKLDDIADNRYTTEAFKSSNVRIVNLGGSNQAIVNGDTLTNFVIVGPLEQKQYPSTKYFPKDGRLGITWTLPQNLLKNDNTSFIEIKFWDYTGTPSEHKFEVKDNGYAKDYYTLLNDNYAAGIPEVVEVPRDISAPSKPENSKVRLINFSEKSSRDDGIEEFYGPVTLAWGDGTAIDEKLSNLAIGEISDYIEIPYGTYQLKVLSEDGRQMPGVGSPTIDQMNSSISFIQNSKVIPSYMTYAPVVDFKPGGIYTVVVYASYFEYPYLVNLMERENYIQNGFRVIADIAEPVNTTFARAQFVNARPEEGEVSLKVSNKNTDVVPFGNYTEYITLIQGKHEIQALGGNTPLASLEYDVKAGDNYTVWLFKTENGTDTLVVSHNDLSGVTPIIGGANTQDASFNRNKTNFFTHMRFFNFNMDFPYATFTSDNGQRFGGSYDETATEQLTPGFIPHTNPIVKYLNGTVGIQGIPQKFLQPSDIMVYKSSKETSPGTWAEEVPILTTRDLITRPELYDVREGKPAFDVGSYSIALIGKNSQDDRYKSKMIIVKHTK